MNKKHAVIGVAALVLGSLSIAFSSTPRGLVVPVNGAGAAYAVAPQAHEANSTNEVAYADSAADTSFGGAVNSSGVAVQASQNMVAGVAPVDAAARASGKIDLMTPPAELPRARSASMITSTSPMAAVQAVAAASTAGRSSTKRARETGNDKVQAAVAKATKPQKLFSYVRLLNFSPHPQKEEFLRDKPLQLNGKNYHFTVTYNEGWDVVNDDEGYLKKLGFEINIYENQKKVRTLKLPSVAINPGTIKKGQILGLAEVAPYRFRIAVDDFTMRGTGISELVFKFDMAG
ncbi:MAG: hypothetical protein WA705_07740 [Candidatus Ozemobacteraceae bacterium]